MKIKFFPFGTLFACTNLYIFGANKVVIKIKQISVVRK